MPQDIRPQGYFPQGTFIIPATQVERQRKLAAELAKAGGSGPVQHWSQGAARLVNALGSVLQEGRANEMENQRRSALAQALQSGDPDAMIRSGEPDLQQVGQFLYQQRRQQAQDEHQAAQDAENKARWEATYKQNADQFAATQERLNQPNFTEGTPDQKEMYGPDFVGMGQNGPIFHTPPATRSPWETKLQTNADGSTTPIQVNRDTGESRAIQSTGPTVNPDAALGMPKMGETEQRSFRFYRRARDANKSLTAEEEEALMSGPQSTIEWAQSGFDKMPFGLGSIPSGLSQAAHSQIYQKAKVKADRIIASLNYSDTGATINKDEFQKQWNALIPTFGNGPDVLAEKRKARAGAISSLKATTGRGVAVLDKEEKAYAEADATIAAAPPERKDEARQRVKERLQSLGFEAENY